ncbi:MAG: hypothetical protein NC092_07380, partial [Butyrivibrio sp.]|nr:hypothetical protein [Butyrivibrio sp.]
MQQGTTEDNRLGDRVTAAANWIVRIIGAVIFLGLTWYSLRYTQYMIVGGDEIAHNVKDSMAGNCLALALGVVLVGTLWFMARQVSVRLQEWVMRAFVAFSMLWTGGWGYWWISVVDRKPEGDQAFVYGAAAYFLKGDFSFLKPGAYCGLCPHQLPLIAMLELLYLVVGLQNYFAYQVLCTLLAAGIVWLGYRILWEMTQNCGAVIMYSIIMTGCLPLIFYTGWVYGDVPSIFFMMLAAWALPRYERTGRVRWLAALVLATTLALLVRLHSAVFLIALCIVGAVYILRKKDYRLLMALALSVLLPVMLYQGVFKMYELRSGLPHAEGMPSLSYISMGMQDIYDRCGWYTIYCAEVFEQAGNDPAVAAEISKQDICQRLGEFRADPAYALWFYREKTLSQWNEPLYQSLYFGNKFHEPLKEEQIAFIDRLKLEAFDNLLLVCDRMQFVIYVGILLYFVLAVRAKSNILQHLMAVTLIGGFLFSLIWEAKARYIMPYYVIMFPIAVMRYWELVERAAGGCA